MGANRTKLEQLDIILGANIVINPSSESSDQKSWSDAERAEMALEMFAKQDFRDVSFLGRLRFAYKMSAWLLLPHIDASLKRALDIFVSLAALVFLWPVIALAALAVRLDSPGPIFFKQTRVGKWGREFQVYKFRSMYIDAEQRKQALMEQNEADGPVFKMKKDPRITRVGRFIRKTSIDELPQLINVLRGNMSLVGPRPPLPRETEQYEYYQRKRLDTTPGITGLQQVSGRSDLNFDRWVSLDIEYIEKQSFWMDIKILLKTIPAVLTGRGAY